MSSPENMLVIMSDEHQARALSCFGLPHRSGPTRMLGSASVSSGVMPPFLYRAE